MAKYLFIGGLLALIAGIVGFVFTFTSYGGGGTALMMWRNVVNGFLVAFGITFLVGSFESGD